MNCALKLEAKSASFWVAKIAADSCCRPKTFTSEWPVYISSMCAFSRPVVAHCRTNCGLRPLADLARHPDRHRHRDQRDHGEQRRDDQHHGEHADDRQQRRHDLAEGLLQ